MTMKKKTVELLLISFLVLFWELLFIRWIPTQLHLISFFRSIVLMAAFLGVGAGCLATSRISRKPEAWIICFVVLVFIFTLGIIFGWQFLKELGFSGHYRDEFTIRFYGHHGGGLLVISTIFIFVSIIFMPLGLVMAPYFQHLPPLKAYTVNIIGSLAGIVAFTLLSFMGSPSYIWFAIGFVFAFLFLFRDRIKFVLAVVLAVLLTILLFFTESKYYWSPYYKISLEKQYAQVEFSKNRIENVFVKGILRVDDYYHQTMVNLGVFNDTGINFNFLNYLDAHYNEKVQTFDSFYRRYYHPYDYYYKHFHRKPHNVLILAAGVGNEVAAALRIGVSEIDAVEIDPGIIEMGKRYHPEHPYNDSRVNIIIADARAYLNESKKKYDMIVMSALDSHAQIAVSSGLRLESYVYTIESFKEIRNHLSDKGAFFPEIGGSILSVPWGKARIERMIEIAFGTPGEFKEKVANGALLFIVPNSSLTSKTNTFDSVVVSTDDWPSFYMRDRAIPSIYLEMIFIILVFSTILVFTIRPMTISKVNAAFFFLGAGFMLLEIGAITKLSLLFGSTWAVNSIVISTILFAILLANIVVDKFNWVRSSFSYLLLFASLFLAYFCYKYFDLLSFGILIRLILSTFLVGAPIFCSGLIFSSLFQKTVNRESAFGFNILGAMVGGLGEYVSLITGVSNLLLIAVVFYLLSFFLKTKVAQ